MSQKKSNQINKIINDFIDYDNGKYKMYINLVDLHLLMDKILKAEETTNYIRISPFYISYHRGIQREFERYILFIQCPLGASELQQQNFYKTCYFPEINGGLTNDEMKILNVLCDSRDIKKFRESILKYKEYLYLKLPELLNEIIIQYNLDVGDLSYGYFCFDITSE